MVCTDTVYRYKVQYCNIPYTLHNLTPTAALGVPTQSIVALKALTATRFPGLPPSADVASDHESACAGAGAWCLVPVLALMLMLVFVLYAPVQLLEFSMKSRTSSMHLHCDDLQRRDGWLR